MIPSTCFIQEKDFQVFLAPQLQELSAYLPFLSEEERVHCYQSQDSDTQKSRATLRLLTKSVLNDYNLSVKKMSLGRPWIREDLDISFSHKNDQVLLGITDSSNRIGVDLESLEENIDWQVFNGNFFSETDLLTLEELTSQAQLSKALAATIIFSAKEAFFKCLDLSFQPRKLTLHLKSVSAGKYEFSADSTVTPSVERIVLFTKLIDQNIISICKLQL